MLRHFTPPNLQNWNKKQKVLLAIAIASVLLNIMAVLPYVKPCYVKVERKIFPPEHTRRRKAVPVPVHLSVSFLSVQTVLRYTSELYGELSPAHRSEALSVNWK